ncbi:MAG TPA: hypothetical protein VNA25_04045, partial [Phycisphaerae bacterium]|nr:hypothetical protein [Phycisphaerae bacterium]
MNSLGDWIRTMVERGECNCGQCIDRGNKPDPSGHTADVAFFKVATRLGAEAETLRALVQQHKAVFGAELDPFDGQEHNYIELGGWLGDQGLALMFMGAMSLLGLAELLTPDSVLGDRVDAEMKALLAGRGMVSIRTKLQTRAEMPTGDWPNWD